MKVNRFIGLGVMMAVVATGQTVITNTRPEISQMAGLWEADSIQISPLANAQYTNFSSGVWTSLFPSGTIAMDGDLHINMAIDSAGTGRNGNNAGNSPIIAEVVNITSNQFNYLGTLFRSNAVPRGIFRFWTEHAGERHFELHPVTQLSRWNGTAYVFDSDYRSNIDFVAEGTDQSSGARFFLLSGVDVVTAAVMSVDSSRIVFTYPSPSANYVQYDGVTRSRLTNDAVSQYFLLKPDLVPTAVVRCRIITNTVAAMLAAGLESNQQITVNALTRTDMLAVSNAVASLTAGQTNIFARPVELITLGISPPFQFTTITREGANIRLTWQTTPGKTNALERTAGKAGSFSNNFAPVFVVINATSTTTNYLDQNAATNVPAFYYRVRLVP